jgi:hypothetical protein
MLVRPATSHAAHDRQRILGCRAHLGALPSRDAPVQCGKRQFCARQSVVDASAATAAASVDFHADGRELFCTGQGLLMSGVAATRTPAFGIRAVTNTPETQRRAVCSPQARRFIPSVHDDCLDAKPSSILNQSNQLHKKILWAASGCQQAATTVTHPVAFPTNAGPLRCEPVEGPALPTTTGRVCRELPS